MEALCLCTRYWASFANIFLNISKLQSVPSEVSSTRDWYKCRKGYYHRCSWGCHKLRGAVSFWKIFSLPAHERPHTTLRDAAQGGSDSNRYQVPLTAFPKQGTFSLQPVNPGMQTPQLESKNKLKAHPLCHVE